jgi:hypothetical protein
VKRWIAVGALLGSFGLAPHANAQAFSYTATIPVADDAGADTETVRVPYAAAFGVPYTAAVRVAECETCPRLQQG